MNIIAEQLQHTGYIVLDNPLPASLMTALRERCQESQAGFEAAHIGRGTDKKQINSIRGDVIRWLDEGNDTDQAYLAWMENLRLKLNEALYLGLFDYECHYAIYGAGTGYAKHSDVLNGKKNRVLTTVLYLNENWQSSDGGELVLFEPDGTEVLATVAPKFGTMIIFLSESFPHEVLISHSTRRSLTGWFRVSGS
ncbi:MAG TPA: proline hydroxylase [Gallionella sp.]|jgi:SM-20-related protein|nr:2OG-Fe(II) oxygenase [Gallionella sp.]OGS68447.1 MAG: proline hydroxylase [Gallionellales bacterium GWA2_54_124]OGT17549.1 MAG: proline hydroxylase [Gallionellales bacterium RIFOXYD12_FULL_53_10]HCI54170.1 proline hydroxylase [Gallionella sp.]